MRHDLQILDAGLGLLVMLKVNSAVRGVVLEWIVVSAIGFISLRGGGIADAKGLIVARRAFKTGAFLLLGGEQMDCLIPMARFGREAAGVEIALIWLRVQLVPRASNCISQHEVVEIRKIILQGALLKVHLRVSPSFLATFEKFLLILLSSILPII